MLSRLSLVCISRCSLFIPHTTFRAGAALFVGNAADENSNAGDGNSDADAEFRSVFEFCDKDNVITTKGCS